MQNQGRNAHIEESRESQRNGEILKQKSLIKKLESDLELAKVSQRVKEWENYLHRYLHFNRYLHIYLNLNFHLHLHLHLNLHLHLDF